MLSSGNQINPFEHPSSQRLFGTATIKPGCGVRPRSRCGTMWLGKRGHWAWVRWFTLGVAIVLLKILLLLFDFCTRCLWKSEKSEEPTADQSNWLTMESKSKSESQQCKWTGTHKKQKQKQKQFTSRAPASVPCLHAEQRSTEAERYWNAIRSTAASNTPLLWTTRGRGTIQEPDY